MHPVTAAWHWVIRRAVPRSSFRGEAAAGGAEVPVVRNPLATVRSEVPALLPGRVKGTGERRFLQVRPRSDNLAAVLRHGTEVGEVVEKFASVAGMAHPGLTATAPKSIPNRTRIRPNSRRSHSATPPRAEYPPGRVRL